MSSNDVCVVLVQGAWANGSSNASVEELALLAAVQGPNSLACITAAVNRPLWKDRPSWLLVAEQDRMIVHENQRFRAERMNAQIRSHQVDHVPIVTAPSVVVELLHEAVASTRHERLV